MDLTPEPLNDNSSMPFGKYKTHRMSQVPAEYLIWLMDNRADWMESQYPEVYDYIEDNYEVLKTEIR